MDKMTSYSKRDKSKNNPKSITLGKILRAKSLIFNNDNYMNYKQNVNIFLLNFQ